MAKVPRVVATDAALALIARLREKHGPLLFHQSGGCCDGSAPMCFQDGELLVGESYRLLGEIGGARFYMSDAQYEAWKHTQLVIDAVPGRGASRTSRGPPPELAAVEEACGAGEWTMSFEPGGSGIMDVPDPLFRQLEPGIRQGDP